MALSGKSCFAPNRFSHPVRKDGSAVWLHSQESLSTTHNFSVTGG